jgi:Domain of unknown function (DUF3854)
VSTTLLPQHAAHLAQFRIPADLLAAAGVYSATDFEARELLGVNGGYFGENLSGIVFLYRRPGSERRTSATVRLDRLLGDGTKYLRERGSRNLYFPPDASERLSNTTIPVVIVEAEKSALALEALSIRADRPLLPVALGGCWNWRCTIGKRELPDGGTESEKGPKPDLDLIAWTRRRVVLAYDANAATNKDVRKARRQLEAELTSRGADVVVAELPEVEGVNGPDDLIAVHGDEAMLAVLDAASIATIVVTAGGTPDAADAAEAVLLQHHKRLGIFQHAGAVRHVIQLPTARASAGLDRPAGSVMLEAMNHVQMSEAFERIARFVKFNKDGVPRSADCPTRLSQTYLGRTGEWKLPVLAGTVSAPIMRPDGSILTRPGYDEATRLFFVGDADWPQIPDRPTKADAQAALQVLLEPFAQFPFASDADRSVHLAAILTAIQRRLLPACPLFAYSAPVMRSGKSLLARCVAIIATGHSAPATIVSREREEWRKVLGAILGEGHAIINFDNVAHVLESPELSAAITEDPVSIRKLGETHNLVLPTNVTFTATGNNLAFQGDLTSRVLMCRIDAEVEKPETRAFKISDLPGHVTSNRRKLVAAALAILRAHHVAERPTHDLPAWGGFDAWTSAIREPLAWLGRADPFTTRDFVAAEDPEAESAATLLVELAKRFSGDPFTAKKIMQLASEREISVGGKPGDFANPEFRAAVAGVAERKGAISAFHLGNWIRKFQSRVIDGVSIKRFNPKGKTREWHITIDKK